MEGMISVEVSLRKYKYLFQLFFSEVQFRSYFTYSFSLLLLLLYLQAEEFGHGF